MSNFAPKEINLNEINSGVRYSNGDGINAEAINRPLEASAWAQEKSKSAEDTAKSALSIANSAVATANQSSEKASQAVSKSNEAVSLLSASKTEMNAALAKADQALAHVNPNADGTFPALTAYPIGSIYMSVNSASPAELFGGTWEKIKDRFLLASGDIYSLGSVGGSANAIVVEHKHIGKYTVGDNTVQFSIIPKQVNGSNANSTVLAPSNDQDNNYIVSPSEGESGVGKNMPPYLVVNVWGRIA